MVLTPRMRLGAYGDGRVGLKTALPGFDVTTLADDYNSDRRSFNSEWPDLMKVAMFGLASGPDTVVTHGLGYPPYYDARLYDPSSKTFYDDRWSTVTSGNATSMSLGVQSDIDSTSLRLRRFPTAPFSTYAFLIWRRALGT